MHRGSPPGRVGEWLIIDAPRSSVRYLFIWRWVLVVHLCMACMDVVQHEGSVTEQSWRSICGALKHRPDRTGYSWLGAPQCPCQSRISGQPPRYGCFQEREYTSAFIIANHRRVRSSPTAPSTVHIHHPMTARAHSSSPRSTSVDENLRADVLRWKRMSSSR